MIVKSVHSTRFDIHVSIGLELLFAIFLVYARVLLLVAVLLRCDETGSYILFCHIFSVQCWNSSHSKDGERMIVETVSSSMIFNL